MKKIPNLIPFLEQHLSGHILDCDVKYLNKPGDNFGSQLYAITVTIRYEDDTKNNRNSDTLNLVAKAPVTNDALKKIFQPDVTCIKENGIFQIVYPLLYRLQCDANVPDKDLINLFPKFYAARLSLNPDAEKADDDALLVMENLITSGYKSGERSKGFDAKTTYNILEKLAQFHSLPIAMRILKPTIFNEQILPLLFGINLYRDLGADRMTIATARNLKHVGIDDDLFAKIHEQLLLSEDFINDVSTPVPKPYTTMVHRDFWVNNLMISNKDEKNIKFFDFQSTIFASATVDIAFFLFTSVIMDDLETHFLDFLKHYHKYFCKYLKQVGCPLQDYSYESFYEEMMKYSRLELNHSIFMHRVLMSEGRPDGVEDVEDDEFFFKDDYLGDKFYNKIKRIALLFEKYEII